MSGPYTLDIGRLAAAIMVTIACWSLWGWQYGLLGLSVVLCLPPHGGGR